MRVVAEPDATIAPPFRKAEPWKEDVCCTVPEPLTVKTAEPSREAGREVLEYAVTVTGVIMISWTWAFALPVFWMFSESVLLEMVPVTCRLGLV